MRSSGFAIVLLILGLSACSTTSQKGLPPLETVPHVELVRYMGRWYEIARFPGLCTADCVGTLAIYTMAGDERIIVIDQCHENTFDGYQRMSTGVARVVDHQTDAKLEVSFQWPFWSDYWIIDLDPDYRWAVVGHPSRDDLRILSRDPAIDDATYAAITERAREKGFDVSRLQRTRQDVAPRQD